jgi:hypothetical protein
MSWNYWAIDDAARDVFAGLTQKSDWYKALGTLKVGQTGEPECSLLGHQPSQLWIEGTRDQPAPICFLFRGEIRAEGGPDPDVGFISADSVTALCEALQQDDSYFLGLIRSTEDAQNYKLDLRSEMLIFPKVRAFFAEAAKRARAAIVLLDHW